MGREGCPVVVGPVAGGPLMPRRRPVVSGEDRRVECPVCHRLMGVSAHDGRFYWHVTDPSDWRGVWCAGSRKTVS